MKDTLSTENKDRLALRMKPDTKRKIDQWYKAAGCGSRNQFVERAVNFYVDHLAVQDDSGTLPRAVLSSLDGRLGMFEDRMASLLYKHSVELDMVMGLLADAYELTEEEISGASGLYWLKEELLYRINLLIAPIRVNNINFKNFEIQAAAK